MKKPGAVEFSEDAVVSIASIKGSTVEVRQAFIKSLEQKSKEKGYFTLLDESNLGIVFINPKLDEHKSGKTSPDDTANINEEEKNSQFKDEGDDISEVEKPELKEGTTYLEIIIKDILVERSTAKEEYWENGLKKIRDIATRTGYFEMNVSAFNKQEKLFANKMFIGKSQMPRDTNKEIVEIQSTIDATKMFIEFLTPEWIDLKLQLDTGESALDPIIELIKLKQYKNAASLLDEYIEKNPRSAVAVFNQAVIYDAMGKYKKALALYKKAIELKNDDMYITQFKQCQQRLTIVSQN